MSENKEHLERLLTESIDGPIDDVELRCYARLARLLAGWRTLDADMDWASLSKRISARVREGVEVQASARLDRLIDPSIPTDGEAPGVEGAARAFQAVDDLLAGATRPLPPVDWNGLSARISAAIRREAQPVPASWHLKRNWQRALTWAGRVGAPIAAAAVIAFALWGPRGNPPMAKNPTQPTRIIRFALSEPETKGGNVTVAFDESRPNNAAAEETTPQGSAIAVGPRREVVDLPVDPAMLP